MPDELDVDAMIARFRERAAAVRNRNLPPIGGDERAAFLKQAQDDFQDFAIIGDATGTIEDGVLVDYMWDGLRARAEGRPSSGNGRRRSYQHLPMVRMTNTYLMGGTSAPDEIVADTPSGVYIAHLGGGQVNTATGDFVFGMSEAYLIEDGRITEPLREGKLVGNGPAVLQQIDAVGNDFEMKTGICGKAGQRVPVGTGQGHVRIQAMTVGGTEV